MDRTASLAALAWQIELGATEAIGDVPVDRFSIVRSPAASTKVVESSEPLPIPVADPVEVATAAAHGAADLSSLSEALSAFEHCELKRGAKNLVFSDGQPGARLMIVGEAPGRDEDIQGKPFVGRAGQLLDQMFAAIGLSRSAPSLETAIYITNVLPWRPPQNRDPRPDEIAMMVPFLERHISLANPDLIVAMGNHACAALLGKRGITRIRGTWGEAFGKPVMPMFHPAYLLRTNAAKRETWADMLALQDRLRSQ